MHTSNPSFPIVFFSQYYSRHPARYIPSFRRGLGRLSSSHLFYFGGAWGGSSSSHLFCFGGAWGGSFWTIFTFPPPYFLFFLLNPSFPLFVTLRFSMCYTWCYKRACFALQKGVFYISKGHLLPCKRCSFTPRKSIYWIPIMKNLVSNCFFPFSEMYWKVFQPLILTYSSQSTTLTFLRRLTVVNVSFLFIRVIIIPHHSCLTIFFWDRIGR